MNEFKKCPNDHYYQGDHCPFCSTGERIRKTTPSSMVKVCANYHAYSTKLSRCPICDSTAVVDKYESGHDTILCDYIRLSNPIEVKIKDGRFSKVSLIGVYISRGYKHGYCFSEGSFDWQDNLEIDPDENIRIGETMIKGRELMRMCDVILDNHLSFMVHEIEGTTLSEENNHRDQDISLINNDNQDVEKDNTCCEPESKNDTFIESKKSREFKKCPNGHYYQGDHCPYCYYKVVKIGRSMDNDYIVDSPQVSEHHCQIEYLGNSQYRIVDLESATGTFVNGKRVEGSCPLNPFDEISVGGIRVPWMHHFASKDAGKGMTLSGIVLPPDDWNE